MLSKIRALVCLGIVGLLVSCKSFDSLNQQNNNSQSTSVQPIVNIEPVSINEGDTGKITPMVFNILLKNPDGSGQPLASKDSIRIDYSTQPNNATPGPIGSDGTDYEDTFESTSNNNNGGTVIIPAGAVQGSITIRVRGDNTWEFDETFRLLMTISLVTGGQTNTVGNTETTGTILNDDNDPPITTPDSLTVLQDSALTTVNVIANDLDNPGDIVTLAAVSSDQGGTVSINVDNVSVDYRPAIGFAGTEIVTYTASDDKGATATGTLTVKVVRPQIGIRSAHAAEGDTGQRDMVFTALLFQPPELDPNGVSQPLVLPLATDVQVQYATADGFATTTGPSQAGRVAQAGSDYIASSGFVTIRAGSLDSTFSVPILGDLTAEEAETFTVTLSNPVRIDLNAAHTKAEGTIHDGLNDTGQTSCTDFFNDPLNPSQSSYVVSSCPVTAYPGQDAESGRDAALTAETRAKIGSGRAGTGFDWIKLDNTGKRIANQAATYTTTPWDCVRDATTGLWWEVKTTDKTLRDATQRFSWYDRNSANNGGLPGFPNGQACHTTLPNCSTADFVAKVNSQGICGFKDWRLPTLQELMTLVDFGAPSVQKMIDVNYFPNTFGFSSGTFWTSSPSADTLVIPFNPDPANNPKSVPVSSVWAVQFFNGKADTFFQSEDLQVRLVRGRE
ncbi:MAG: DUF1566 domain-containing protein [Gammaproteobacteria bacterium]|nr:MAG: DUF1566 domain-containing protein [Gammaproteobacteria bacterium]